MVAKGGVLLKNKQSRGLLEAKYDGLPNTLPELCSRSVKSRLVSILGKME